RAQVAEAEGARDQGWREVDRPGDATGPYGHERAQRFDVGRRREQGNALRTLATGEHEELRDDDESPCPAGCPTPVRDGSDAQPREQRERQVEREAILDETHRTEQRYAGER